MRTERTDTNEITVNLTNDEAWDLLYILRYASTFYPTNTPADKFAERITSAMHEPAPSKVPLRVQPTKPLP